MSTPKRTELDEWVERIRDREMPIFGRTARNVMSVTEDENAPAAALAKVILEDASMTARVLKLANSTFYNPIGGDISTVSRAVMVLGFNAVQNMSMSISLVDSFVRGSSRERMNQSLARSIHAAVQSRTVAEERGDRSPEEVFIATLLFRLGDLAFWCFAGDAGDDLDALLKQGMNAEKAQEKVLGFRLRQLTVGLAQTWKLGELLRHTVSHTESRDPRVRCITLCHQLAEVTEQHGWHSSEAEAVIKEIADLAKVPVREAVTFLHHNAREAVRIASYYGAKLAAESIPVPGQESSGAVAAEAKPPVEEASADKVYPEPNGILQLKVLRELSLMLEGKVNFNLLMELVLEGMHRGVGLDRALFALLTPDRKGVRAKYALGQDGSRLTQEFHFLRHPQQQNLLFEVVDKKACVWFDRERRPELARLVPTAVTGVIGTSPFYTCPIVINGQVIGLFYADRTPSGRKLDNDSYESFKHFAKQANMGLSLAAMRRG